MREGKHTYAFFLMFKKHLTQFGMMAYGLRYRKWGLGVGCGENMYAITRSAVLLEGEKSKQFHIGQGVAQGCSMSPILFSIFINQLLDEIWYM